MSKWVFFIWGVAVVTLAAVSPALHFEWPDLCADPHSLGCFIAHLCTALSAIGGAALGAASPGWRALFGNGASPAADVATEKVKADLARALEPPPEKKP